MEKVIGKDKVEMKISTTNEDTIFLWDKPGYFQNDLVDFSIEKTNLPENTLFYLNQGYQIYKEDKKIYYNGLYILGQILPAAIQPKDIDDYEFKENEVKILQALYNRDTCEFLGLKYLVGIITIRDDEDEMFFDYGNHKNSPSKLFCSKKSKIPNCFSTSIFNRERKQYEAGVMNEQDFSKIYFYLPLTVDRCEKVNKYMTSVYLKPVYIESNNFGENLLNDNFKVNRELILVQMKKIAKQSLQNLIRNADSFLAGERQNASKNLIWPGGERIPLNKFKLSY